MLHSNIFNGSNNHDQPITWYKRRNHLVHHYVESEWRQNRSQTSIQTKLEKHIYSKKMQCSTGSRGTRHSKEGLSKKEVTWKSSILHTTRCLHPSASSYCLHFELRPKGSTKQQTRKKHWSWKRDKTCRVASMSASTTAYSLANWSCPDTESAPPCLSTSYFSYFLHSTSTRAKMSIKLIEVSLIPPPNSSCIQTYAPRLQYQHPLHLYTQSKRSIPPSPFQAMLRMIVFSDDRCKW